VAKAFKRKGGRFVAHLDEVERGVVVGLLEQTQAFLAPVHREPTGDTFDDLVATLGVRRPGESGTGPGLAPRDPALERLLPTAHREDPEMAAEFRRLTEYGLRERKTANLATAIAALRGADKDKKKNKDEDKVEDRVSLDQEQAQATVVALTDVRLLLGERLGLRTDDDADALQDRLEAASEDDPELFLAAYYDFLTWLQESLIQALMD
jgi:hypothetical protein